MQKYKLVVSDLDGTLLNREMQVSPENKRAIAKMDELGVAFAISSGRTYAELPEAVRDLEELRYLIYSDGSVIQDKKTGVRECMGIDRETVKRVLALLEQYETLPSVRHEGNAYVRAEDFSREGMASYRVNEYFYSLYERTSTPIENCLEFCSELDNVELFCVFFRHDDELNECRAKLEEMGLQVVSSDPANLEIISAQAGKGKALLRLADKLGLDAAATIAVGDSLNDTSMLLAAGRGLVMSNASDEIKRVGDEVICSNEEHCAAYILEHFIR